MVEDLLGAAFLDDAATLQEQHPRADVARELHLVRDDDHRPALPGQFADDAEHLRLARRVEGGSGLVEQDHLRVHRQGAGDGHALPLTAGKAVRHRMQHLAQTDHPEQFHSLFLGFRAGHLPDPDRAEHHVLQHVQVREHVHLLEHHPDLGAHGAQVRPACEDILPVHVYVAGVGLLEPVQAAQEGALSAAGRADQGDDVALADRAVDSVQHALAVETLAQRLCLDDRLHFFSNTSSSFSMPRQISRASRKYSTPTTTSGIREL